MMLYFYMVQIFKLARFTCILKSMKHVGLYLAAGNFLTKFQVVAMHLVKKTSDAVFLQTSAIACTVPFMHFRDNIYKVIVPIDRR